MVSTKSLSCLFPTGSPARRRLPSRGSRGPWFPTFTGTMRRYDCHHIPLRSLRLSLASRYLACFRGVRGVPHGLATWWKPPGHARAFGRPVPLSGNVARRQVVLPSSQVTPMNACPALRGCLKSLHGFLQRYPHAMVIVDFRELRTIVTSSEAALHQLKTLMSGLFKQPLREGEAPLRVA